MTAARPVCIPTDTIRRHTHVAGTWGVQLGTGRGGTESWSEPTIRQNVLPARLGEEAQAAWEPPDLSDGARTVVGGLEYYRELSAVSPPLGGAAAAKLGT